MMEPKAPGCKIEVGTRLEDVRLDPRHAALLSAACRAEELVDIDELEAYAEATRQKGAK
jgi:hypothetical protein